MRILPYSEKIKRGCTYCAFVGKTLGDDGKPKDSCPYKECPYHELDNFDTYTEYLKEKYKDARRLL